MTSNTSMRRHTFVPTVTLLAAITCGLSGTPASASGDSGLVALIRNGDTVWLADTASDVLATITVASPSTIAHPEPGLVVFIGDDHIEHLDVATGDVTSVPLQGVPPHTPPADGQRIAPNVHNDPAGDGDEPGPLRLEGLLDIVSGEAVDIGIEFTFPEIVARTSRSIVLTESGAGYADAVVIPLDREFTGVIELPAGADDVLLADDGARIAVLADGDLHVGGIGDDLRVVASGVDELVGAIPGAVVVRVDGTSSVVDDDGAITQLPADVADAEVVEGSGLLRAGQADGRAAWFRVDAAGTATAIDRVSGMTLVAAEPEGWWFSTGDAPAPFDGSPLVAVDPADGSAVDVNASLATLAALAGTGRTSPSGGHLFASFRERTGSTRLAVVDVTGSVRSLSGLHPPLVFAPDGVHILSSTQSGPTITTIERGNPSEIVPISGIDVPRDADVTYHWITTR